MISSNPDRNAVNGHADGTSAGSNGEETAVIIVGAGPYGLSIAAHLRARGIAFRIFGQPMATWLTQMPAGMHLKSEGFASNLYDPGGEFPLVRFCSERGIPYAHVGVPVALETFAAYGLEFAQRFVPSLEQREVVDVSPAPSGGFEVRLADGGIAHSRAVIVAAGITHFRYVPPVLAGLPSDWVSHTSQHPSLERFAGRSVAVVGAGASAADVAALLQKAGATTHLVARTSKLKFHDPPEVERPLWKRLRYPRSGLGIGWKAKLFSDAPDAFFSLPAPTRTRIVGETLGPAPCWFTKRDVEDNVELHLGATIERAEIREGRVRLELASSGGATSSLEVDHAIAGTGYRVDLERLRFLGPELRSKIETVAGSPKLSRSFEASLPGLYFTGVSAANSFGPLLRFAFGARFSAVRLSGHLASVYGPSTTSSRRG